MGRVFDDEVRPGDDLFALLAAADTAIPPLHVSLRHRGLAARVVPSGSPTAATAAGVDVTTDFRPGDHEWSLWDAVIQDVIAWLPVQPGRRR